MKVGMRTGEKEVGEHELEIELVEYNKERREMGEKVGGIWMPSICCHVNRYHMRTIDSWP